MSDAPDEQRLAATAPGATDQLPVVTPPAEIVPQATVEPPHATARTSSAVEPPQTETPARLRLARLAEAVVDTAGTVTLTAGALGTWTTRAAGESVHGIEVHAADDGRYELELHLLVAWPPQPLHALADELRDAIARAATRDGAKDRLGAIEVHFEGLDEPAPAHAETAR